MEFNQIASHHGVKLSSKHLRLLHLYLNELVEWNKNMNLTGLKTRDKIVHELVLDSLIPAPTLPHEGSMLDVGSGAGFPGIPIKIFRPQLNTILLEPNLKKVHFLKQIIRLLELDRIEVIRGRIEGDNRLLNKVGFHVVTARGLNNIGQIVEWCSPYIRQGGLLIAFLGNNAEAKIQKEKKALKRWSLERYKTIPYVLPDRMSERSIVFFKKQNRNDRRSEEA